MPSKKSMIIALVVVAVVVVGAGIFMTKKYTTPPLSQGETSGAQKTYTISDFPFEVGESYGAAKDMLINDGWAVIIPKDRTRSPSTTFPEITDCGSGVDDVCSVDFKKGDEAFGFYLMHTTRAGKDDSVQWVVGADY